MPRTVDVLSKLGLRKVWEVRCPSCHGQPTRIEGCWSNTESPRVVWTCPNCDGEGVVSVEHAREGGA